MTGSNLQHEWQAGEGEVSLSRRVGAPRMVALLTLICVIVGCGTVQPALAKSATRTVSAATATFEASRRGRAEQKALSVAAARHGLPPGIPVPPWATKPGRHVNLMASPAALRRADRTGPEQSTGMHAREPLDPDDNSHGVPNEETEESEGGNLAGIRAGEVPPIRYLGGVVQHNPTIHVLFWGTNWSGNTTRVMQMFNSLSGSTYQGIFTQYFDKAGYISSQVTVNSAIDSRVTAPTNVGYSSLEQEVAYAETLWGHNLETQYEILPAPGSSYQAEFAEGYCAFHGVASSGAVYSFVPYGGDEPFSHQNGCLWYGRNDALKTTSSIASHEYAESATDPLWDTAPGWRNRAASEGEISDICATPGSELASGAFVQGQYDDHQAACSIADEKPPHVLGLTEPATAVTSTSATMNATINPENQATNYYFEYGATTAYGSKTPVTYAGSNLENIAVSRAISGLETEHIYHYRVVAENASGKTSGEDHTVIPSLWVANTPSSGSNWSESWLNDLSCPTEGACMSVGYYFEHGLLPEPNQALSYQLVSGSWVRRSVPQSEEEGWPELEGVSCPGTTSACIAVGVGEVKNAAGEFQRRPLIVRWNGTSWTQEHVALPPETLDAELTDVSCWESLAKQCMAVGVRETTAGTWLNYSVELVNGTWVNLSTPSAEASTSVMEGVACSYASCRAVGWYNPAGGGNTRPFTAVHTTAGWQYQSPEGFASGGYLSDITCQPWPTESCVSVGRIYGSSTKKGPVVYTWNGSSWLAPVSLNTSTTREAFLEGVSCLSIDRCVAVGGNYSAIGTSRTYAARLDAKGWAERTTPSESEVAPNQLDAVSCGGRSCTAVGFSAASDAVQQLLETQTGGIPLLEGLSHSAVQPTGYSGSFKLTGKVDPNGYETHVRFEWATKSEYEEGKYGHVINAGLFGAGTGNHAVEATVSGLEREKTYYYRLVGENAAGLNEEKGNFTVDWRDWGFPEPGSTYVLSGTASETTAGAGHLSFSSTLLSLPVSWECNASSTGTIVAGGTGTEKIALSGCAVTKPSKCQVSSPTLQAKTELVSVGGTTYEKFVPSATSFGTFAWSGAECPLNEASASFRGSFAALPPTALAVERALAFTPAANTAVGATPMLGMKTATDEGSISEHLAGKSATGSWRSIWEGTHGGWELQSVKAEFLKTSETISVSGGPINLHFTSSWGPISIACTGVGAEGATIVPGGSENPSKFKLTGCTASQPSGCTAPSTIFFEAMTASLQVVNGQVYETFVPTASGGAFFWLTLGGGSCPLYELQWKVGGSFSGIGYNGASIVQSLEFSAATEAATGSKITFGTSGSGTVTGSFKQQLSGSRGVGRPWGAF